MRPGLLSHPVILIAIEVSLPESRQGNELRMVNALAPLVSERKSTCLEVLLGCAVTALLVHYVRAREHDLHSHDDGDEHAHLGRGGGDD